MNAHTNTQINAVLRKVGPSMALLALLATVLALVVSAAGVGYAAGQIGSKQIKNKAVTAKKIKNNAVTTKKIKSNAVTSDRVLDGSLTVADLVKEEPQKVATLGNGGEGDCLWQSVGALIPGTGTPAFRKDRFGAVHLSGMAVGNAGGGGDGVCSPTDAGQAADAIVYMLPAGYVPAHTMIMGDTTHPLILVGARGYDSGGLVLPPGAVAAVADGAAVLLDGIIFEPVGSSVVLPKMVPAGRMSADLMGQLGLG